MTRLLTVITGVLVFAMASLSSWAESFVWQVSQGDSRLYIGGTIHLLKTNDYPLPMEFDQAFSQAQALVLEADVSATNSTAFQQQVMQLMVYQDGRNLQSELQPETFKALRQFCQQRSIPIESLLGMKPALLTMTLSVLEMQRHGYQGELGVDRFYLRKARLQGKKLIYLESLEKQLQFMANMGKGQEDVMVMHTLRDLADFEEQLQLIKHSWRQGRLSAMDDGVLKPMRQDYPQVYQTLLVERNNDWLPQLKQLLSTPETELVLVGALHLVGPDGVLQQLQKAGYTVSQL